MSDNDAEIRGRIVRISDMAVYFRPDAKGVAPAVWLPRSRIAVVQEPGGFVTVSMPYWLAVEKGLEAYA